jgi:hypothetical protein
MVQQKPRDDVTGNVLKIEANFRLGLVYSTTVSNSCVPFFLEITPNHYSLKFAMVVNESRLVHSLPRGLFNVVVNTLFFGFNKLLIGLENVIFRFPPRSLLRDAVDRMPDRCCALSSAFKERISVLYRKDKKKKFRR